MTFSKFKKNKWFKRFSNRYFLILIVFVVWMFFFDTNSFFVHKELNDEINELNNNREYFQKEITHDKGFIDKLKDDDEMEKFARETYFFKKENEDIFIIEHQDSLKKKK